MDGMLSHTPCASATARKASMARQGRFPLGCGFHCIGGLLCQLRGLLRADTAPACGLYARTLAVTPPVHHPAGFIGAAPVEYPCHDFSLWLSVLPHGWGGVDLVPLNVPLNGAPCGAPNISMALRA